MTRSAAFLALTFGISLTAFVGIALIPGAQTPESPRGLPVWLLAVWAPSLSAGLLAWRAGALRARLASMVRTRGVPVGSWLLSVSPLLLPPLLGRFGARPFDAFSLELPTVVGLLAFNLVLGPLGEELGFRGFLQTRWQRRLGFLPASLLVASVWLLWHLPLWLVDSPQRQIPVALFAGHVFAYAITLGAMQARAPRSVAPAIVFHLSVNVVAGWALLAGFGDPAAWYRQTLPAYGALAAVACLWAVAARSAALSPGPATGAGAR